MPHAHLATVLLKMHEDFEASYESPKRGPNANTLTPEQKESTPVLVLDALKLGAFITAPAKAEIPPDEKLFLIAFPGFDITKVPGARDKGIAASAKNIGGQPYVDGPIKPDQ